MFAGDASSETGTQKSTAGDGKWNPAGITPTTVREMPSTTMRAAKNAGIAPELLLPERIA